MPPTDKPDLVISTTCREDITRTWALDPHGRQSFRIVVKCKEVKAACGPKSLAHPLFSLFSAFIRAVPPLFPPWRLGGQKR